MAWTTPTDRATGYLVTAVDWNIIEDNLSYLVAGNVGTAGDTAFTRVVNGQVSLGSTSVGLGNLLGAYASFSGNGGTFTPDGARFYQRWVQTGSTALTIANPANTPPVNTSGQMFIEIHNSTGGALPAITFGANYSFQGGTPPTFSTVTNATSVLMIFVYSPGIAKWVLLSGVSPLS